MFNLNMLEGLE